VWIIERRKNIRANGGRMPGKLLTMTAKQVRDKLALVVSSGGVILLMRE
jgi:hypothetical protein